MEIEITWKRTLPIWWAYLWRNIIALVVSIMAGSVAGFVIGFMFGLIGVSTDTIQVLCGILGGAIGLALSVVPMKMILGKKFGNYRLVLVSTDDTTAVNRLPGDNA